jgi:hypothetical protein
VYAGDGRFGGCVGEEGGNIEPRSTTRDPLCEGGDEVGTEEEDLGRRFQRCQKGGEEDGGCDEVRAKFCGNE